MLLVETVLALLAQEVGDQHQVLLAFMDLEVGALGALRRQKHATRPGHVNHIHWPVWCTGIFIGRREAEEEIHTAPVEVVLHTPRNHTMFHHKGWPARQQDPLIPQVDLAPVAAPLAPTRLAAAAAVAAAGQ